jgi:hypothetical protein
MRLRVERSAECGLTYIEEFYGETLGSDLVKLVAGTPTDQIIVLREALEHRGLRNLPVWNEEVLPEEDRQAIEGGIASDLLMLDHALPLSTRPGLDLMLLTAPTVRRRSNLGVGGRNSNRWQLPIEIPVDRFRAFQFCGSRLNSLGSDST